MGWQGTGLFGLIHQSSVHFLKVLMMYLAVRFCLLACFLRKQISKLRGALEACPEKILLIHIVSMFASLKVPIFSYRFVDFQNALPPIFKTVSLHYLHYQQCQQIISSSATEKNALT